MLMIKKYYFTLKECINELLGVELPYSLTNNFSSICTALNIDTYILPFEINDNVNLLWKEIYALYLNEYIYIKDYEEFKNVDFKQWFFKVISKLSRTYDYYNVVVDSYNSLKSKLLDDIKTSTDTTIKYNDTPQEFATFDDEQHLTNLTNTHNESTTPFATPMEKLKTLQDNYQKVYNKWCNEFNDLFIEEQTKWGC